MSEPESPQSGRQRGESTPPPAKESLATRLLVRRSLTARRAALIIAAFTLTITVAGGILERIVDHEEFHTIGKGLWFTLQTVTTVGYGDVTPHLRDGRLIAAAVMLTGIGFVAVITAAVAAELIENGRRRASESGVDLARRLDEIGEQLVRIEAALKTDRASSADELR
jgi:voltage-gated potassium channel